MAAPAITTSDQLSTLATRYPAASRVFMRHSLDYCCGGKRTLADACVEARLDPDALVNEIAAEFKPDDEATRTWENAPLVDLIEHIVAAYHVKHKDELPRLLSMAKKVFDVHGTKDARLAQLLSVVNDVADELYPHMAKEEEILFPWIASGKGNTAVAPIEVMTQEHELVGEMLAKIRDLTDAFTPPGGACTTWRALWKSLEEFDADLREHIHLENNILFPRTLAS